MLLSADFDQTLFDFAAPPVFVPAAPALSPPGAPERLYDCRAFVARILHETAARLAVPPDCLPRREKF